MTEHLKTTFLPVILTKEGNPTNFHRNEDGTYGARVTADTATHLLKTVTTLEPKS